MKRSFFAALLFTFLFFKTLAQTYVPGQSYFGTNGYVEYLAGNLPIIVTAPHGGLLSPASMDIVEAADGNPDAALAWNEFHIFVETAKNQVLPTFGKGFYIDLHGHAHAIQRLELGYLLSQTELQLADNVLDGQSYINQSSLRHLSGDNAMDLTHAELLRGPQSLGSLLAGRGYPATPSLSDPFPDPDEDYFNGGYNTVRHSSYPGGALDGLQIECNRQGVRDSMHNVLRFADSLSVAVLEYLGLHYFGDASKALCPTVGAPPEPPTADFFEIFPNPYCVHFFVKLTAQAPVGNWVCEVYDFYGNLLKTKILEQDQVLEIAPRNQENMLVVLRRDGQVSAIRAIIRSCR